MSRQLRASCDACNQAKVKCSKQQPKCARCLKNGYADCVYGISLRVGRRTGTQATPQSPKGTLESPRQKSLLQHERETSKSLQLLPTCTISSSNDDRMHNTTYSSMDNMDLINHGGLLDYDPFYGLENNSLSHSLSFDHYCSSFSSQAFSSSMQDHLYLQDPISRSTHAGSLVNDPSNTLSNSITDFHGGIQTHACSCFSTVLATLSDLHQLASSRLVTFEVALSRNKEATTICCEAIKCGCTPHSTAVMIFSSLITNIIAIYQLPKTAWIPPGPPSSSDGHTLSTLSSSASDKFPFTVGGYILGEETEDRFKEEIMRMELCEVEGLIAILKEKYCSNVGYRSDQDRVCEALVTFLVGKVKTAFESLRSI